MKKILIAFLVVMTLMSADATSAFAYSPYERDVKGPYEGTFRGYVYGEKGSKAPITLELKHRNGVVTGEVTLGEGLYVKAGRCGGGYLPATTQYVNGKSLSTNPRRVLVGTSFNISGFEIGVDFESNLSRDGRVLSADAEIDIPWLCGRDPQLSGTLYRVK